MPLEFKRSWSDEDVERFRDSWVRFVESEMLPHDAEARRLGHVGHELWSRAGELGFLCVDIPEEWGGAGGDFRHEPRRREPWNKGHLIGQKRARESRRMCGRSGLGSNWKAANAISRCSISPLTASLGAATSFGSKLIT